MKILVLYYSKTGNNRYLAKRCSDALDADMEKIRPRLGLLPLLIFFSLLKRSAGIHKLKHDVASYDLIILCGPVWMGQLIVPLRAFLKQYGAKMNTLAFVTCCGGGDDIKDDRFGYASVFREVEQLADGKSVHCEAFPIVMILPEDKRDNNNAVMETRLNDDNFNGTLQERFDTFIEKLKGR